jgi:D-alanyl-D-alanine carboxypeptidase
MCHWCELGDGSGLFASRRIRFAIDLHLLPASVAGMNFPAWRRIILLSLLLLAHTMRADKVDDYLRGEMKTQKIPGLALAVVKAGKLEKSAAYGFANVELGVPLKKDTVFQIQSVTKTFTASAVMLLVEEGKLRLEDRITNYLANLPESWRGVTVRHLLTHTSGIKDFINEPTVDLRKDLEPEAVIDSLRALPLNFAPGEKYAYCNTGYHLLAMIIHKVTGMTWGEFLNERVLQPLGMKDTAVITLSGLIANRASGYALENGQVRNGRFIAQSILGYAGGGLRSTAPDLAKWDAALYTEKILKRSSLELMWQAAKLNDGSSTSYGLGWGVTNLNGHRFINHTGSHMTGFKTILARFPDDRLTIIILSNLREADIMGLAKGVARMYEPDLRGGAK